MLPPFAGLPFDPPALDPDDLAAIHDGQGRLLWQSAGIAARGDCPAARVVALGFVWLERIHVKDAARVLLWLTSAGTANEGCLFLSVDAAGRDSALVCWRKIALPRFHWLVFGAAV